MRRTASRSITPATSSSSTTGASAYTKRPTTCRSSGAAGEFRQRWGKDGQEPGQFDSPQGVAVDAAGNFYVADTVNNRVQKFSIDGRFLTNGSTGYGLLRNPSGIALDTAGNLFVVDNGNRRVQKFSPSGLFISKWAAAPDGRAEASSTRRAQSR